MMFAPKTPCKVRRHEAGQKNQSQLNTETDAYEIVGSCDRTPYSEDDGESARG
jgi:hypothetical protein